MSLRVWLPLNGDLYNQGLSNVNLTNTVTFATSGKIGASCLNSQLGWFAVPEMAGKKQMSFAYWVKLNTGTTTNWLDSFSWYSTNGTSDHRSRQEFYYYNSGGNTEAMTTGVWYYTSSNSGLTQRKIGQWYHYAFTIDYATGITQFFVDGVLWKTTTDADTSYYVKGNNFLLRESSLDCSINDFRLYDHILSELEVKEIARAKILHYPLNNNGISNLEIQEPTIEYDISGYCNNGTKVGTFTYSTDTPKYRVSTSFSGSASCIKVNENNVMAQYAQAMTINLWAKASSWAANTHFFSCTEGGGFNTEAGNSGYLRFSVNVCTNAEQTSYSYKYDSQEIQLSALPTNEWVMLTWIYDTTGTRTYINGQLHHTYTNTSYGIHFNINARLFLGCEASGANPTTPYFNGKMSDFRMYYTALSAQDILSLYHNSALVDEQGIIHGAIH